MNLLLAIGIGLLVLSATAHGLYWYEAAGTPEVERLRRLGPLWRIFLRHWLQSVWNQVQATTTAWLFFVPGLYRPLRDDGGPVVVLVHGLWHSAGAWILFRRWLAEQGLGCAVALTYPSWSSSLPELGERLVKRIHQLATQYPDRPLALVGHSMGGLLIRMAMADPLVRERTAAVVTLGTPHQGSKLAAFGLGATSRSLLPGSPALRNIPAPQGVPWLCVLAELDCVVLPPASQFPPPSVGEGWTTDYAGTSGHVGMVFDEEVARRTAEFIRQHAGKDD